MAKKDVLNNLYVNKKENIIKNEYKRFIIEKPTRINRIPEVEVKYYNLKINDLKNKSLIKKFCNKKWKANI